MADHLQYDTTVNLANKNNSHTLLVLLAGRDKKVLEVGPATGYCTRALAGRGCRVTCIEINPEAAEIARAHSERMIVGSVEAINFDEVFANETFDVVLYGDVLEHLLDPEEVLRKTTRVLAPGGYVVASIPNVAHASVRLTLLHGNFRYTDVGLLDRTHLRFFTRETVAQLFDGAGYAIQAWRRVVLSPFETELELKPEDYPGFLVESVLDDPDAQTYQFVVQAVPRTGPSGDGARLKSSRHPVLKDTVLPAFWRLHDRLAAREAQIREQQLQLAEEAHRVSELEASLAETEGRLRALAHEYQLTTHAVGFRALQRARRVVNWLLPPGSRRRGAFRVWRRASEIALTEGWWTLLKRSLAVWRWGPRVFRGARMGAPQATSIDDQYQLWLAAHALSPADIRRIRREAAAFAYRPTVSIVVPAYNTEPDQLRDAIESVRGQHYDGWELCIADDASTIPRVRDVLRRYAADDDRIKVAYLEKNGGISAASNATLALATGDFVGLLDHDDELKPDALYEVVKLLNENPGLDFIYTDEDKRDRDGSLVQPFFKPDFSPDLLLCENYVPHFAVYRRSILEDVGGFRTECDFSQDYDLVLRVTERTDRIAHIPLPLYTWRMIPGSAALESGAKPKAVEAAKRALSDAIQRRGLDAEVLEGPHPNTYRVRYRIHGQPLVTIIIPTRDRVGLLRACINSIEQKTTYPNYEIVIVDNDSADPATLDYLKASPHRVIPYPGAFHYAAMMNFALRETAGEHVILLNNDTEVITPDWIESMLEHSQRPEVAAVGARLLYPDGSPQHEGVIIGLGGGSALNADHKGYFGLGDLVLNCTAVTGACMMVRREAWERWDGFDETLGVAFNDVDYCLRAHRDGYRIIYTPFAVLYHHESASRGALHPEEDEQVFRKRWGKPGEYRDPYYNPNLSLIRPFNLDV